MKITQYSIVVFLSVSGLILAQDNEKPVKFTDLPAAVQKGMTEQTKGTKVRGYNKEVEDGKTFYEAETIAGGKSKDILFDEAGAVVEVEQATDMASIPAAAKAGLEKAADGGKIVSVEMVTKGSNVAYEAVVGAQGKKHEVAVKADGTLVKK